MPVALIQAFVAMLLAIVVSSARAETTDAAATTSDAQLPDTVAQTRLLATSCTSCHSNSRGNAIPMLYGRKARRLEKYLRDYKSGKRKGTLMPRIARGYRDEQLTQLARYFATTPAPTSTNGDKN